MVWSIVKCLLFTIALNAVPSSSKETSRSGALSRVYTCRRELSAPPNEILSRIISAREKIKSCSCGKRMKLVTSGSEAAGGVRPFLTAHLLTPPRARAPATTTTSSRRRWWLVRIAEKAAALAVTRPPRVRSIKRLLAATYVCARVRAGGTTCVEDVLRTGVHNVPRVASTHG